MTDFDYLCDKSIQKALLAWASLSDEKKASVMKSLQDLLHSAQAERRPGGGQGEAS